MEASPAAAASVRMASGLDLLETEAVTTSTASPPVVKTPPPRCKGKLLSPGAATQPGRLLRTNQKPPDILGRDDPPGSGQKCCEEANQKRRKSVPGLSIFSPGSFHEERGLLHCCGFGVLEPGLEQEDLPVLSLKQAEDDLP